MQYIDDLMRNHPVSSDTEFSVERHLERAIGDSETPVDPGLLDQFGGSNDAPTGGFPPIYVCSKIESDDDAALLNPEQKKKREYESDKSSVKIQDIMKKRTETKPFIPLS